MLTDKTIAFIGGGNMAEAIIRGLVVRARATVLAGGAHASGEDTQMATLINAVEAAMRRVQELGLKT